MTFITRRVVCYYYYCVVVVVVVVSTHVCATTSNRWRYRSTGVRMWSVSIGTVAPTTMFTNDMVYQGVTIGVMMSIFWTVPTAIL